MKVKIGEFDVECTVEEFEALRKPKKVPMVDFNNHHAPAPETRVVGPGLNLQNQGPFNGLNTHAQPVDTKATLTALAKTSVPNGAPAKPEKEKVIRGVKSLIVGTVGKYGQKGLTRAQIVSLSGLHRSQVQAGLYAAMYAKSSTPVLLQEKDGLFFCTEAGESYALASDFGKMKIVHQHLYLTKSSS